MAKNRRFGDRVKRDCRRTRDRRARQCVRLESLEERLMLASDGPSIRDFLASSWHPTALPSISSPSNVFAQFPGTLSRPTDTARFQINVNSRDFTLGPSKDLILGFEITAAEGSHLDPAAVDVLDGSGKPVKPTYSNADLAGRTESLVLSNLRYGDYTVVVGGERGTAGAFQLDVFLAGDVNGDRQVNKTDGDLLRGMMGAVPGDGKYRVEADGNLDGQITGTDNSYWARNQQGAVRINPLRLTEEYSPAPIALPDGSLVTNVRNGVVQGTTAQMASLALETGSDGRFDEGSTTADALGHYSFPVTLGEGANTLQVRATDGFGQQRTAAVLVVLDIVPPTIALNSPISELFTNHNVTIAGLVTDDRSGVASLRAKLDDGPFVPVTFDPSGHFSFPTALLLDGSADGNHTVRFQATDRAGNVSGFTDLAFTLDTHAPIVTFSSPSPGLTATDNITITGQVTDDRSGVASLQAELDNGPFVPVAFDASGHFSYPTTVPVDGSADGKHVMHFQATDFAGNASGPADFPFMLETCFSGMVAGESGGSASGHGTAVVTDCNLVMREGDSFTVTAAFGLMIPSNPSSITFTYDQLAFDTRSQGRIKDAFEVALVDQNGHPLVTPYTAGRDAFFNITEGVPSDTHSPQAAVNGTTVTLDLSAIPENTVAKLIFRLVNNDTDQQTSVYIASVHLPPGAAVPLSNTAGKTASVNGVLPIAIIDNGSTATSSGVSVTAGHSSSDSDALAGAKRSVQPLANQATGSSNLVLTDAGTAKGFSISTFVSGFPVTAGFNAGLGPLGIAFPNAGGVLVTDYTGNIWHFSTDADGQHASDTSPVNQLGLGGALGLAKANGVIYMTDQHAGRVYQLSDDGTSLQLIADNLPTATGITANPVADANGHQHLFVSASSGIWDIDPIAKTSSPFFGDHFYDGLSTDGQVVYAADPTPNKIVGISIATKQIVFDSGTIPGGVDGTTLGTGTLLGNIFINTPTAGLWEQNLATKELVQIADGPTATRGDFVSVDPNGTLLATQSGEIDRITPPQGGGFGTSHVMVDVNSPGSQFPSGTKLVISGEADSILDSDGSHQLIIAVVMNHVPVDVLDAAGKFFAQVTLLPGQNTFEFTATDAAGNTASTSVVITGTQKPGGQIDFSQFADISASFKGVYGRTSFNAGRSNLYVDLATRNDGTFESSVPLLVGVEHLSDPLVQVIGAAGVTPGWVPYYDYSSSVVGGKLNPGETTAAPTIAFYNPTHVPFSYDLIFYGKLNQAPQITSVPGVEAIAGKPYSYQVAATDPDSDSLTFSLVAGPPGIVLDTNHRLTWTPTTSEIGNHDVTIRVDDSRGGTAEQHYVLSTIAAPPNRPPVFTTLPVVTAIAHKPETVELGFDGLVGVYYQPGTIVGEPSRLSDQFLQSDGVSFSSEGGPSYVAVVNLDTYLSPQAPSAPNGIGGVKNDSSLDYATPIVASFFLPNEPTRAAVTDFVSVQAEKFGVGATITLDAFDIGGNQIAHTTAIDLNGPILTISHPGIHSVRIHGSVDTGFDNFQFHGVSATTAYEYRAHAVDADGDVPTYALLDGPAGMVVDPHSGLVSWNPIPDQLNPTNQQPADPSLPVVPGFDVSTFANLPSHTQLTFSPTGDAYIGNDTATHISPGSIFHISGRGVGAQAFGPAFVDPDAVLFDASGLVGDPGSVLVGENSTNLGGPGVIYALAPDGTAKVVLGPTNEFINPQSMVFDRFGRLLLADYNRNAVEVVDHGAVATLFTLPAQPTDLAYDQSTGHIYVVGQDGVVRVFGDDSSQINPAFLTDVTSVAVGPGKGSFGTDLYAVRRASGELVRVDVGGTATIVGTGFTGTNVDGFGPDGALYVQSGGSQNRLLRIAPNRQTLGLGADEERVLLAASDGRGGVATQDFTICVLPEPANHPPVIISQPVTSVVPNTVAGGSIFLTGEDPDAHATAGDNKTGAQHLIEAGIGFVTDESHNIFAAKGIHKFLFVESTGSVPPGYFPGINGIVASGYVQGVDFDLADSTNLEAALAQLGTTYDALVVASDFGGILRQPELDILNAHSADIVKFLNQGGGLFASAESNGGAHLTPNGGQFGYLPFVATSTPLAQNEVGNTVTSFGSTLGLSDSDVNGNFSHNVFNAAFGLNIVDQDSQGRILTLAGRGIVGTNGVANYVYDVHAIDPDSDPLKYSLVSGPLGMAIDAQTGKLTWSPPVDVSQVVFSTDFSQGVPPEFSGAGSEESVQGFVGLGSGDNAFAGNFLRNSTTRLPQSNAAEPTRLVLNNLPQHESINVEFLLAIIDSWDGTGIAGPDSLEVRVDGQIVFSQHFDNAHGGESQDYAPPAGVQLGEPARVNRGFNTGGAHNDAAYDMSQEPALRNIPHTSDTLTVEWVAVGAGWQGETDESFAIDNVRVALNGVKYPVTVRVDDGRGGSDEQSFTVSVAEPGKIEGTVFDDQNQDSQHGLGRILLAHDVDTLSTSLAGAQEATFAINVANWLAGPGGSLLLIQSHDDPERDFSTLITSALSGAGFSVTLTPEHSQTLLSLKQYDAVFTGLEVPSRTSVPNDVLAEYVKEGGNVYLFGGVTSVGDAQASNGFLGEFGLALDTALDNLSGPQPISSIHPVFQGVTALQSGIGNFVFDLDAQDQRNQIIATSGTRGIYAAFDGREPGLAGRIVFLDDNHNGRRDSGERFTTSDTDGNYSFDGLAPGTYYVAEDVPAVWLQTAPTGGRHVVDVVAGASAVGIDFGNLQAPSNHQNESPTFVTSPGDQPTGTVGSVFRYDAWAFDPEGDPLTFDLPSKPDGMVVDPETGTIVWTPTSAQLGTQHVVLRVQDGKGGVALQPFDISVSLPNSPPVVTSSPLGPATVGLPYEYQIRAQDAEGDALTIKLQDPLPSGMTIDGKTGLLSWLSPGQAGSQQVAVLVDADHGPDTTYQFTIGVVPTSTDRLPVIDSTPHTKARAGQTYAYLFQAHDPDGDPLSYTLDAAPVGMTIGKDEKGNPSPLRGLILWTPAQNLAGQQFPVRILVSDGRGAPVTQEFSIDVLATNVNAPPTIVSTPSGTATAVGHDYEYDLKAEDPDGDPLVWTLVKGPAGMSLDRSSGVLVWAPDHEQLGPQDFVVRVQDTSLASDRQSFTLVVSCANLPPVIVSRPPTQAVKETSYVYPIRVSDPENDSVTLTLGTHPEGMTPPDENNVIHWTPTATQAGNSFLVEIEATDGAGGVGSQIYNVFVAATAPNRPPIITSSPRLFAPAGSQYEYDVAARDPDGDQVTFSLGNSPAPPAGMQIDPQTGKLTWNVPATGSPQVTVIAQDTAGNTAKQMFTIQVRANQPPHIDSTPPSSVAAGATYRYDVHATDPDADPLTYELLTGPAGMTLDQFGRLLWPVASGASADVSLRVTDPGGLSSAPQSFTVQVLPDNEAPKVTVQVGTGNVVFLNDEPFVYKGTQVFFLVRASDNVGVKSTSLELVDQNGIHTVLPLDGSGRATMDTPAGGLFFDVIATATDGAGNTATAHTHLRVVDPAITNGPTVTITSPVDPLDPVNPVIINYLTPVTATVQVQQPSDNLQYYRVLYARVDQVDLSQLDLTDPDYHEIARHNFTAAEQKSFSGQVAVFDPTMLLNDNYVIVVAAFDVNGLGRIEGRRVQLEGNAKLGQFRQEFTDLQIPLAGIPVTITRVYDTRQAGESGDFGFGWTLGLRAANIRETVAPGEDFVPDKTRVYLTDPDGNRVGFTYHERFVTGFPGFGAVYDPYFTADPGVYDQLAVDGQVGRTGALGGLQGVINFDDYTLTTKDGRKYRYDQTTGLQSITDLNGNQLIFQNDGIYVGSTQQVAFHRDGTGRITAITYPAVNAQGQTETRALSYSYDVAGDLRSFKNEEQLATTFSYKALPAPAHYLDEIHDALGHRVIKTEYNDQGRIIKVTDANGNEVTYDYDDIATNTETVHDTNGNASKLTYDDRGNVTRKEVLDTAGTRMSLTLYEYGDVVNRDKETKVTQVRGGGLPDIVTSYQYDTRGNTTQITDAIGTRTFQYNDKSSVTQATDELDHISVFHYDAGNNLREVLNAAGDTSHIDYDAQGRPKSYTDFRINTTTFDYLGSQTQPGAIHNAGDGSIKHFEYNQFGEVTKSTDEAGVVTTYAYDNAGRLTREQLGNDASVVYEYTGQFKTKQTVRQSEVDPTKPDLLTQYGYYDNGLLKFQIDSEGHVTGYRYDANGNQTMLGTWATKANFDLENMAASADPHLTFTHATFQHKFYYDGANRVSFEADDYALSLPAASDADRIKIQYHYDQAGNRDQIIDRDGRKRTFEYDDRGRLRFERWFDHAADSTPVRTIEYRYDATGNVVFETDPDSTYTFTYDTLGRLKSTDNAGTPDMPHVVLSYGYDQNGNQISVSDNLVGVTSTYDPRNRLDTRGWVNTSAQQAVDQVLVNFDYCDCGQISEIDRYTGAVVNPANLVAKTVYDNHDAAGRVQHIKTTTATDAVLSEYNYQFDPAGLVKHADYTNPGNSTHNFAVDYVYDKIGQLKGANFSAPALANGIYQNEFYNYDDRGNRTSSYLAASYRNGPGNRLLSDGTFNYEYDNEGNTIFKRKIGAQTTEVTEYKWDERNRLVEVDIHSAGALTIVVYKYDVQDRRIAIEVRQSSLASPPTSVTHMVYDGDHVWADFDAAGTATARYLYGNKIDQILARFQPGTGPSQAIVWYLTDRLGSIQDLSNAAGQAINHVDYSSFGNAIAQTNVVAADRYLFTGRELDPTTQQYYFRARYYGANTGRFSSTDTVGFSGGDVNLYRSLKNSPLNGTDPFGRTFLADFAVISYVTASTVLGAYIASETLNYDCPYLNEEGDRLLTLLIGAQTGALFGFSLALPLITTSLIAGYGVSVVGFVGVPVTATLLCDLFKPTNI